MKITNIKHYIKKFLFKDHVAKEICETMTAQSQALQLKLDQLITKVNHLALSNTDPLAASLHGNLQTKADEQSVLSQKPLMFAPKTYNTNHPDYDAGLVRNFPGKIFNLKKSNENTLFGEFRKLMQKDEIPAASWDFILEKTLEEVRSIPHANQVFERKAYVESYLKELEANYGAYYLPGWVNLEDALFLYWIVRKLNPKTIVQTGVCNGLSSAFMVLALVKNGSEQSMLHVVDMPPVFDSSDPSWKVKGEVHGVVIPEGKTSGWLVPDAYQRHFSVLNGDAKVLLPSLLEKVGPIDMFYHDSDHSYDHMFFEFTESKKYLNKQGVIVSDDISWNASLWDFADQYNATAYNYRGSMGIAFF